MPQCQSVTKEGSQCKNKALSGENYCRIHHPQLATYRNIKLGAAIGTFALILGLILDIFSARSLIVSVISSTPSPTIVTNATPLPQVVVVQVTVDISNLQPTSTTNSLPSTELPIDEPTATPTANTTTEANPETVETPNMLQDGIVAFHADIDGNGFDIFIVQPNGTGLKQLTSENGDHKYPSWSPNGKWIAYQSTKDGTPDIYIMDRFGENTQKITKSQFNDVYPTWLPDNETLAFQRQNDDGWDIYTVGINDGFTNRVTNEIGNEYHPHFSPDGSSLVYSYQTNSDSNWQIRKANADGSNISVLAQDSSNNLLPKWSPDGMEITFYSNRDIYTGDLYLMNADGSNIIRLTESDSFDGQPSWAPMGSLIVYVSYNAGQQQLWLASINNGVKVKEIDTGLDVDIHFPSFGYLATEN